MTLSISRQHQSFDLHDHTMALLTNNTIIFEAFKEIFSIIRDLTLILFDRVLLLLLNTSSSTLSGTRIRRFPIQLLKMDLYRFLQTFHHTHSSILSLHFGRCCYRLNFKEILWPQYEEIPILYFSIFSPPS